MGESCEFSCISNICPGSGSAGLFWPERATTTDFTTSYATPVFGGVRENENSNRFGLLVITSLHLWVGDRCNPSVLAPTPIVLNVRNVAPQMQNSLLANNTNRDTDGHFFHFVQVKIHTFKDLVISLLSITL
jgi:hypothetical protein